MKSINLLAVSYIFIFTASNASYSACNDSPNKTKANPNDTAVSSMAGKDNIVTVANYSDSLKYDPGAKDDVIVTPEMFGAVGDGKIRKLSTSYQTLEEAQRKFPGVKDLDITVDGAAFQQAVDFVASKGGGEVVAEKDYAINFPILTRSNVTIDGKSKGIIYNDRSRKKNVHHDAFFTGNHLGAAFNANIPGHYTLYDVKGRVPAGQNYVQLANPSESGDFKTGQLVMLISDFKRQQKRNSILPYHITVSKIVRIDGSMLYFEYPVDENIEEVQIAAERKDSEVDAYQETKFAGVENVTIRNFTIDAAQITRRTYGYKCHIDNIKLINGYRLVGANALTHSTITNISGTFSYRCMEIKTGSSDLLVRNINGKYKAVSDTDHCRGGISTGEYNRNIIIDSFTIDLGSETLEQPIITIQARKATISNGIIYCKNQTNSFLRFYNELYVSDPEFGCYGNKVSNVKFYGSSLMKSVMSIGGKQNNDKENNDEENNGKQKMSRQKNKKGPEADTTEGSAPTGNLVENCLFDGGTPGKSYASFNEGQQNIVRNCTFTKAKLKIEPAFQQKNNTVTGNREQQ